MFSFVLVVGAAGSPVTVVSAGTLHHSDRHPLDLLSGFFVPAVAEPALSAHREIPEPFRHFALARLRTLLMPDPSISPPVTLEALLVSGAAVKSPLGLRVRTPHGGKRLLVCAMTDLDGTANDEHVAEHLRLSTIGPARDAFAQLAEAGVVTGICTARSSGEARHYRRELGVSGPVISENGAVVEFADGSRQVFGDLNQLREALARVRSRLGRNVPSSLELPGLIEAWQRERSGLSPVFLGHPDLDSLCRSADRRASCFLVGLTPGEKLIVTGIATEMGLGCFGELLHLIPAGADKGRALAALNAALLSRVAEPGEAPDLVAQIVFGNGDNDLPLFEQAIRGGGAAVLVGDPSTPWGFHFDTIRHPVPDGVISLAGVSHGYAIQRSLPLLKTFFAERYGILFPW